MKSRWLREVRRVGLGVALVLLLALAGVGQVTASAAQPVLPVATELAGAPSSDASWTGNVLSLPEDEYGGDLSRIACVTATSCTAVGNAYGADDVGHPMADTLSGGHWKATILPTPADDDGGNGPIGGHGINDISCSSDMNCVAVGEYYSSVHGERPLIETLDHGVWSASTPPLVSGAVGGTLYGVSCPSPVSCVAVGVTNKSDLVEVLAKGEWAASVEPALPGPNYPAPNDILYSVSCVSATSCTSVGSDYSNGQLTPIVVSLSAQSWELTSPPSPTLPQGWIGTHLVQLNHVACTSATHCVATGIDDDIYQPMYIETLAGGQWTPLVPPEPPGEPNVVQARIIGLSCPSDTSCTAIGLYNGGPMIETLANGEWTNSTALPSPTSASIYGYGVACPTASSCIIVGQGNTGGLQSYPYVEVQSAGTQTTTVVSGPSTGTSGSALTIHADVQGSTSATNLPASAGSVQFAVGGTDSGSPVPLTNTGAAFSYVPRSAGIVGITATYIPAGGENFVTSSSYIVVTVVASPSAYEPDEQTVVANVPAGTLVISTPYTAANPFNLGTMTLNSAGTGLTASAPFGDPSAQASTDPGINGAVTNGVTITDTRPDSTGWTASAATEGFTGPGGASIPSADLSFTSVTPKYLTGNALQTGSVTSSDIPAFATTPTTFASTTDGPGTVNITGVLGLNIATSTIPGLYTATLTITIA